MREDQADQLIAAIKENTAATLKLAGASGGGKPATAGTTSGSGTKLTFEMVKTALLKVRDEKGKPTAQKIVKDVGKADESANIKPAQYKAVMDACQTALEPDDPDTGDGGGGDDDTL